MQLIRGKAFAPNMVMCESSAPSPSSGASMFSLLSPSHSMIGQTSHTNSSGGNNNHPSPEDFFQYLVNKNPFLSRTSESISSRILSPQNKNNNKTGASELSASSPYLPTRYRLSRNEMIHQLLQADDHQQWQKFQEVLRQKGAITNSRLVHDLESVLREQIQEQEAIIQQRQKEKQKQEQKQRQEQSRGENGDDDREEDKKPRGGQHRQEENMIQSHNQNDEESSTNLSAAPVEQKTQNQCNWHNNFGLGFVKMFLSEDEDDDSEDENPKKCHHHDIIISSASYSRDLPLKPASLRRTKKKIDPPPSSESTATTKTIEERRGRGMIMRSLSSSPTPRVQRGGASQETGRRRISMDHLFCSFESSSPTSSYRRVISPPPCRLIYLPPLKEEYGRLLVVKRQKKARAAAQTSSLVLMALNGKDEDEDEEDDQQSYEPRNLVVI